MYFLELKHPNYEKKWKKNWNKNCFDTLIALTVQPRYNVPLILRTFQYSVRFLRSRTERLFVFVFSTLILRTFTLAYIWYYVLFEVPQLNYLLCFPFSIQHTFLKIRPDPNEIHQLIKIYWKKTKNDVIDESP